MFASVQSLSEWLAEHGKLILTSPSVELTRWAILRQSVASGDFNPAHCVPKFAPHSFFRGMVSHGIGMVARAEGAFLQLVQFVAPAETIALGIENLVYRSPLRCGDRYYYVFEISNLRQNGRRWDCDCGIVCKATSPGKKERVIAEWAWRPSFIEPGSEVSLASRELLRPTSYRSSVLHHVVLPLASLFGRRLAIASCGALVLCSLTYGLLVAQYRTAEAYYRIAQSLCHSDEPFCYYGTGP